MNYASSLKKKCLYFFLPTNRHDCVAVVSRFLELSRKVTTTVLADDIGANKL